MVSQFGPYKLIRQVAVGGMAEIHLAKTAGIAGFEKYVAIKMIHPNFAEDEQFIQMLVDEAKIAVQLTHGNIAQTFDLGRVGETYYITMEYVDGADLYKILRRASEQDLEMPLDVCAFVAKEISSALDHAHRKRDHTGKSLGIVHRDVSPQNVLVSYSGEVKLVDFGIAKATMKARQTAVGVIKGKYYYMSPEQARGDLIDHRSDIFSAGIVLYEMMTGQMLYLEEDLHKLLEMARAADIAPPSRLRRGVPPQLERIVMHALAKNPEDRYQSAGDFATDLERFLHAYSPVFTASKLSSLLRQVVGDPMQVPDEAAPFESIEFRDGVMSTHPLDDSEVAHAIDRDELRDENSVIFRVSDLERPPEPPPPPVRPPARAPGIAPPPPPRAGSAPPVPGAGGSAPPGGAPVRPTPHPSPMKQTATRPTTPSKPIHQVAPRVTRATDALPAAPPRPAAPAAASVPGKIPSIAPRPTGSSKIPQIAKPRQPHEETRQLDSPAPPNPLHDDSGLLTTDGRKLWSDVGNETSDEDLDNIGERTLVTAMPGSAASAANNPGLGGFMLDAGDDSDGPVEATLVTMVPGFGGAPADAVPGRGRARDEADDALDDDVLDAAEPDPADEMDDDMPTLTGREGVAAIRDLPPRADPPPPAREPARQAVRKPKAPPPAALAAKIHAPAVSELRKPRASRRTPPGGSPVAPPNVLQAIVSAQSHEPMPAPRQAPSSTAPTTALQPTAAPLPPAPHSPSPSQHYAAEQPQYAQQPPYAQPYGQQPQMDPYAQYPAGNPSGAYATDASGLPMAMPTPNGMQAAPGVPNHLQPYLHMQGMPPGGYDPNGYPQPPQMSPQALYQFQPAQPQQPMSLTKQMRLFEADEMPSQYKIGSAGRRWFMYIVSGVIAISVAASATFLIIRSTRDAPPTMGSIRFESVPSGANAYIDDQLSGKTPVTVEGVPVGSTHVLRIELAHHRPLKDTISIPQKGGELSFGGRLDEITGKILIDSKPPGAEIRINNALRGHTPTTLEGFDLQAKVHVELRLKDYQPFAHDYEWPADGKITIDAKLDK